MCAFAAAAACGSGSINPIGPSGPPRAFIAKAVSDALRQHPIVNATLEGDNVVYKKDVNVGIAVALESGLIVPVNHHADEKNDSISVDQLHGVLEHKGCHKNVTLVAGDICETVPAFVVQHPELRIALLHVDVDMYEPSEVIMKVLAPLVVPGYSEAVLRPCARLRDQASRPRLTSARLWSL